MGQVPMQAVALPGEPEFTDACNNQKLQKQDASAKPCTVNLLTKAQIVRFFWTSVFGLARTIA
ncbi:hypothetical protein [Roseibium sp.]|uniref:hypothetical protein n=1 Tax=Roseibium sp. TaxID=1936156 RepID=UPI003BAB5799